MCLSNCSTFFNPVSSFARSTGKAQGFRPLPAMFDTQTLNKFISFPWSQGTPSSIMGLVSTPQALNSRRTHYAKVLDQILINCLLVVRTKSVFCFVTVEPVWLLSCLFLSQSSSNSLKESLLPYPKVFCDVLFTSGKIM